MLALLAAYLHYLSLAFIGLMVVTNLGLASCLLKTDGSKHLWTACAGILLPNAFISRDTVEVILGEERITHNVCPVFGCHFKTERCAKLHTIPSIFRALS